MPKMGLKPPYFFLKLRIASPIFSKKSGKTPFIGIQVRGFAPTCREPQGRAIGILEQWNCGMMG